MANQSIDKRQKDEIKSEIIRDLRGLVHAEVRSESVFVGPIPPPEILEGYNRCLPNGADRVISMAERQSEHRQSLESYALRGEHIRAMCGLFFGGSISICIIIGAIVLGLKGHEILAGTLISLDLVTLASVFVYGAQTRKRERIQKAKMMAGRG